MTTLTTSITSHDDGTTAANLPDLTALKETDFNETVAELLPQLTGYFLRRLGNPDDAADAAADVLFVLVRKQDQLPWDVESLRQYSFGVARKVLSGVVAATCATRRLPSGYGARWLWPLLRSRILTPNSRAHSRSWPSGIASFSCSWRGKACQ